MRTFIQTSALKKGNYILADTFTKRDLRALRWPRSHPSWTCFEEADFARFLRITPIPLPCPAAHCHSSSGHGKQITQFISCKQQIPPFHGWIFFTTQFCSDLVLGQTPLWVQDFSLHYRAESNRIWSLFWVCFKEVYGYEHIEFSDFFWEKKSS